MANKNINGDVNVSFTEAQSRQSLESGESVKTLFGKLRKWLSDLKPVAFTGSYNDLDNKPTIPTTSAGITAMTGYSKPQATSAIAATDTLNEAIGKLEKAVDDAGGGDGLIITDDTNNIRYSVSLHVVDGKPVLMYDVIGA